MRAVDYRGLAALDAVITHGSFEKGALALSISQPAVSQRIRTIEQSTGRLLLVRSKPPVATEYGQRLMAHYRQVHLLEATLDDAANPNAAPPLVAIAVNADSAATWLPQALAPLLAAPACLFDIRIDDQDHTLLQLREGRVFACVSSAGDEVAGTTATALGVMRYVCVCTPAFAARWFPAGLCVDAALQAPALIFGGKDALHPRFLQQRLGLTLPFPHHVLGSSEGFVRFLEAGFAYGMVPLIQVRAALASGALVHVGGAVGMDVPLFWHAWDIQTALTRSIAAQIVQTAHAALAPLP